MKHVKKTKLFIALFVFCIITTRVSLADLRVIRVSADNPADEFTELFDVKASNANADPIQFTIVLKNNRKWEGVVLRGGRQVREVRGLVQTARVEIIRHNPFRMSVEFPLVFTTDDHSLPSTSFTIERELLSDGTAMIVVDGFGILAASSKLGSRGPVMFEVDLASFARPGKS